MKFFISSEKKPNFPCIFFFLKPRNQAQCRYTELNQQVQEFNYDSENFKNNPESKYDNLVVKQNCVNDALSNQVQDARDKLAKLSHSLKNIDVCGKGEEMEVSNVF